MLMFMCCRFKAKVNLISSQEEERKKEGKETKCCSNCGITLLFLKEMGG